MIEIAVFYLGILAWAYLVWILFIAVMHLYKLEKHGKLVGPVLWLAYPVAIVAVIADWWLNVLATLVFFDAPSGVEELLTGRLKRYMQHTDGWRKTVAEKICTGYLDYFDPTGDHC